MTRLPEARVREDTLIRFAERSERATVEEVAALAAEVLELRKKVKDMEAARSARRPNPAKPIPCGVLTAIDDGGVSPSGEARDG